MAEPGTPGAGITPEQLDEILDKKMGAMLNNAISARVGPMIKKELTSALTGVTEGFSKTLDEKFQSFKPTSETNPDDGGGKGGKRGKDDPELATLRQQMAAMASKNAEIEARANAMREKNRTQAIRDQVRAMLGKGGIDGERFEAAYALLAHTGRIVPSEDQDSDDAFFVEQSGADPVVLEVGLNGWLKSEQAKIFLPPSGLRGSGSRPGTRPSNGQPLTPEQIRANIVAALDADLQR